MAARAEDAAALLTAVSRVDAGGWGFAAGSARRATWRTGRRVSAAVRRALDGVAATGSGADAVCDAGGAGCGGAGAAAGFRCAAGEGGGGAAGGAVPAEEAAAVRCG